jgi:hypothetical protein
MDSSIVLSALSAVSRRGTTPATGKPLIRRARDRARRHPCAGAVEREIARRLQTLGRARETGKS